MVFKLLIGKSLGRSVRNIFERVDLRVDVGIEKEKVGAMSGARWLN